jgi:hypothetical protein
VLDETDTNAGARRDAGRPFLDSPEEPMMLHDEFYASYDEFVNSRDARLSERETTEVQTS